MAKRKLSKDEKILRAKRKEERRKDLPKAGSLPLGRKWLREIARNNMRRKGMTQINKIRADGKSLFSHNWFAHSSTPDMKEIRYGRKV